MPNKQPAGIYVCAYDLHYPKVDWPSWKALLDFMDHNEIKGFIFGGDQFDNQCISRHTKGKPGLRDKGAYLRDEKGFKEKILSPLDEVLPPKYAERIWIVGNHDDWERDIVLENPEFDGFVDRVQSLELEKNGWTIVPLGRAFRLGKLNVIHGEILTGIGNQGGVYPARKAVAIYAANVLAGHTHAPQSFTQIAPVEKVQKWQAWISPILGNVNPGYLQNRPTAWLNGFTLVELMEDGNFNVYPVVVTKGKFSFGGKVYGK